MPPKKRRQAKALPQAKRARLQSSPTPALCLLDLPSSILELILTKTSWAGQQLLRSSSKQLKLELTAFIIHKYTSLAQPILQQPATSNSERELQIGLRVLGLASDSFLSCGYVTRDFEQIYALRISEGKYLRTILREYYSGIVKFRATTVQARNEFQRRRLLYTITLLNLLRSFGQFSKVSSGMNLMHWELNLEIKGVYVIVRNIYDTFQHGHLENKLITFLSIMAELLTYEMYGKSVRCTIPFTSSGYLAYGLQSTPNQWYTKIKLRVLSPPPVRSLIEAAVEGNADAMRVLDMPYEDRFSMLLEIKSRAWSPLLMGDSALKMCILPLK
ncbi:uncharacterized protein LOC108598882 [Drosophila busckii]|uniref:uncharacterized protein LOC108598882 n=1 Tax=Drosophila busckii TaxID=30019 RepID=UPI00143314FC|nr:uncharacterized protein LOC108598882 [Drosophila busckii]